MANLISPRGRPREFNLEMALNIGQRLFHANGYEAVGIAALTDALAIKPPSFYKAFGSKASYFERILQRYSQSVLPLGPILYSSKNTADALSELLQNAARTYSKDAELRGCLVLETVRGRSDNESTILARRIAEQRRKQIRDFVARENKQAAAVVTDYIVSIMSGLSASAREGMSLSRLLAVANAASAGIKGLLDTR